MNGKLKQVISQFVNRFKTDDSEYRFWIFQIWIYTKIEREIFINDWDVDRSEAHYLVLDTPWFRFYIWKLGEKK